MKTMDEQKHSEFPPSGLERVILCPASWKEKKQRPEEPQSEYAAHGTLLHSFVPDAYHDKSVVRKLEEVEDRYLVLECVDYIHEATAMYTAYHISFEDIVDLGDWNPQLSDIWGTADVVIYDHKSKDLHVIDWKFGKGVKVYAFENIQGLCYLAGAFAKFPDAEKLHFHLVQPTLDHAEIYTTTPAAIDKLFTETVIPALDLAKSSDPPYSPSLKACRFCIAKTDCRARHEYQNSLAKEVFTMHRNKSSLTVEEISRFLDNSEDLEAYIQDLKKHAKMLLTKGNPVPGYKLVYGKSNRAWKDPKKALQWLLKNTALVAEDLFTSKLKGPAAVEKADKPLKTDPEFLDLIEKPPGKPSLARENDKRDSVTPNTEAANAFAKFKK